jgi:hypothetical protein
MKMFSTLPVISLLVIQLLTQASYAASLGSKQLMKGKVTLAGSFVYQATNFTSSTDPKPNMPPTPVDSLTFDSKDSSISALVHRRYSERPYGMNDKDTIDYIELNIEGKLPSGRAINARIVLQPLMFSEGAYPGTVRFPFNKDKKFLTSTAENGKQGFTTLVVTEKNGFDLGIGSSGCSPTADLYIQNVYYDFDQNNLYQLKFTFKGTCNGWQGQAIEGQAELTFDNK